MNAKSFYDMLVKRLEENPKTAWGKRELLTELAKIFIDFCVAVNEDL